MESIPMNNPNHQSVWTLLADRFQDAVQSLGDPYDMMTIEVGSVNLLELLQFLKVDEQLQYIHLTDITAVHYPDRDLNFTVVYHLQSLVFNRRLRIKVPIGGEPPQIPSATSIWKGANWMERETYDFFGIQFVGHPDLRRILNMEDMEVFPMRKEYPLEDPNRTDKKDLYFGR